MAEKSGKKKTKKAGKTAAEPSVLGSLRSTRPTRLGGERRASTRRAAATPRAAAAKTSAATKPSAAKKSRATAKPKAAPQQPRPVESAPPAGWQTPGDGGRRRGGPPSGTELVTTAVQAAGELAQLGATLTGRLLRRAADRLPRP